MLNKCHTYQAARAAASDASVLDGRDAGAGGGPERLPGVSRCSSSRISPTSSSGAPAGSSWWPTTSTNSSAPTRPSMRPGSTRCLVEWIPGRTTLLCSYYTYLDGGETPRFHFTKRVIRRFPAGMGNACYHVTDWNPEVRDLALRLFRWVGLLGLANAEFKRDERDGQLKLIECNARSPPRTAWSPGAGSTSPPSSTTGSLAVRNRRSRHTPEGCGSGTPSGTSRRSSNSGGRADSRPGSGSPASCHRQTFPYFHWSDPTPSLIRASKPLRQLLSRGRRPPAPAEMRESIVMRAREEHRCRTS